MVRQYASGGGRTAPEQRRMPAQPVGGTCFRRAGCWALLLLVSGLTGCGGDDPPAEAEPAPSAKKSTPPSAASIPVKNEKSAICRVYTTPPGAWVLVDMIPIRDEQGALLTTPCALTIPHGLHEIMVARTGYRDASTTLTVPRDSEVQLQQAEDPDGASPSILHADFFEAEVGEPIPLLSLHSPQSELDPYLTPDGLQLWFVGDRAAGKGIYVASRSTPYHAFDEPEFILASRGRDLAASPSVTRDGLSLVYLIPEDAKIWMLTRPNPLAEFGEKIALKFSQDDATQWRSSQITGDGLRVYWVEDASGKHRTMASVRKSADAKFGRNLQFKLPGGVPCLSDDGLRQYAFDGKILKRARRGDLLSEFSAPQVVASLNTNNYVGSDRRQFCVSDDEQWLVYSDNPRRNANLYIVRIFQRPAWGFIVQGKRIPDKAKPQVAEVSTPDTNSPEPDTPTVPPVDPRTLPTAYAQFRGALLAALSRREFAAAEKLVTQARQQPELAADRELLEWDRADVQRLVQFWSELHQTLQGLQPGDPIRFGSLKLEFISFRDQTVTAGRGGKQSSRSLSELQAGNLVALVESGQAANDAAAKMRSALFLYFDAGGNPRSAKSRLARAGEAGQQFLQQQAERLFRTADREFKRENLLQGLKILDQIDQQFPGTVAAGRTLAARQNLYQLIEWEPRGEREWVMEKALGLYEAPAGQSAGAFLVSPRVHENFELQLEWKTQGPAGQGGVYFRYPGQGRPSDVAFKLQLSGDFGIKADQYATGALFKVEAPSVNAVKPTGQWNTLVLRVMGEQVQITINQQTVMNTRAVDSDIPLKGRVVLDGESGGITYRKTLLIDLPADPQPGSPTGS